MRRRYSLKNNSNKLKKTDETNILKFSSKLKKYDIVKPSSKNLKKEPIKLDSTQIEKIISKRRQQRLEKIDDDLTWIEKNHEELKKYSGKYVAILNHKIIGVGSTSVLAYKRAKKTDAENEPIIFLVPSKKLSI